MRRKSFAQLCEAFEQAELAHIRAFNRYVKLKRQCERASKLIERKTIGGTADARVLLGAPGVSERDLQVQRDLAANDNSDGDTW